MPVNLRYTEEYAARKAALSDARRLSLSLIEEGIQVDPHGRYYRRDRPDGSVVDYSEQNLYVTFRLLDDETAEMMEFLDLDSESIP